MNLSIRVTKYNAVNYKQYFNMVLKKIVGKDKTHLRPFLLVYFYTMALPGVYPVPVEHALRNVFGLKNVDVGINMTPGGIPFLFL